MTKAVIRLKQTILDTRFRHMKLHTKHARQ